MIWPGLIETPKKPAFGFFEALTDSLSVKIELHLKDSQIPVIKITLPLMGSEINYDQAFKTYRDNHGALDLRSKK